MEEDEQRLERMEQELQGLRGQGAPQDRVEAFAREVADFRDALRRTASRDASARSEVAQGTRSVLEFCYFIVREFFSRRVLGFQTP